MACYNIDQCSTFIVIVTALTGLCAGHVLDNRPRSEHTCHGVHYEHLGCFDVQPPFTNTRWLPQSPSFVGTAFLLHTRQTQGQPDRLLAEQRSSIVQSSFQARNPTKILVHGFLQHRHAAFLVNTTRALLAEAPMNVIVVGWSGGAGFPYGQAVANTRLVGVQLAQLVSALVTHAGARLSQVHIIGHSLGSHVAGYAGARLPGLGRITGLDPAQPNYHGFDPEVRLDPTDAILVDVIHTDGIPFDTVHGYGMVEPVGHIDFYPNGGHNQPGCHEEESILGFMEDALTRGIASAETGLSCSHERSTTLFLASISQSRGDNCHFTAFPCESEAKFLRGDCTSCGNHPCPMMGLNLGIYTRARGVFYLNTTNSQPFCGHHHFVTLKLSESMPYAMGNLRVKLVGDQGETHWTTVKSGQLDAGQELPTLILSEGSVGEVISLKAVFDANVGYFSWGSDRVMLDEVKVYSQIPSHPKYFCTQGLVLRNGEKSIITGGSFTRGECL